ncbi:MAG: membrane protein insertion efficiency factor YidD [Pseudomonadota bacterium]
MIALSKFLLIKLIRIYQLSFSFFLGSHCRFHPTCSQYAIESLQRYGLIKGSKMAFFRLMRCHPWGGSGYQPVEEDEDQSQKDRQIAKGPG